MVNTFIINEMLPSGMNEVWATMTNYETGKNKPETTIHLSPGSLEYCIADPLLRQFVSEGYRKKSDLSECGPYLRLDKPDGSFVILSKVNQNKSIVEIHYEPTQKSND